MHDVVVAGAGLAGLRCAELLKDAGLDVVVLEARDRVGGRTHSDDVDGARIDLGAQWLGAGQERLKALAERLGVTTFPTFHQGDKLIEFGGSIKSYSGTIPALPILSLLSLELTIRRTRRALDPVTVGAPWESSNAAALDRRTLADWRAQTLPPGPGRESFDLAMRIVFGAEVEEVSLLQGLHYAKAAGGLMPLVEVEGGAQQDRFHLGAQELSKRLAATLDVRLSTPVRKVRVESDRVVVEDVEARRAVMALPLPLVADIEFSPALPFARTTLSRRSSMGATTKFFAFYERAFWRERGLSGEGISDQEPMCFCIDASQEDGSHPALLGFLVGNAARRWGQEDPQKRSAAVLDGFARLFGDEARRPIATIEKDWVTETFTGGCPVALMTPGTWSSYGKALTEPVGRIHWAGTETASEWCGYMEGALQSAERAAAEILTA